MKETAIDIKNLSAGYDHKPIIEQVTLQVQSGDFYSIIGPNGGGKTTLLKAILGLIPVQKGSIKIFNMSVEQGRKYIGYVPQHAEFDTKFPISVWDVVLMGRRNVRGLHPFYSEEDKLHAHTALDLVDMGAYAHRHISKLSGGQRQRVFIARALASDPKILLLDEPTASIDKEMKESIYHLLGELNKKMTVVLITHDIGVLSTFVGRISCLNRYLFSHDDDKMLSHEMLEAAYSCPVELIAHGVPHRVLDEHPSKKQMKRGKGK